MRDSIDHKPGTRRYRIEGGKRIRICGECGLAMQMRTNKRTGEQFWGCSGFPVCSSTAPIEKEKRPSECPRGEFVKG